LSEFIVEPERRTPVAARVDVLVAGAGPAGFAAAVSAARQGAKVLLVEQSGAVGGVATNGLMSHWTGRTEGGMYEEILRRSAPLISAVAAPSNEHIRPRQIIDHEGLKTLMLEMLSEAGVRLRLYTFASAPLMEGDRVRGCFVESKAGREVISARITVDATGDGDVAARAGAAYIVGRETDQRMQPASLMLKVGGVDTSRVSYVCGFEDDWQVPAGSIQALAKARLPAPAGHVLIYPGSQPGSVVLNMTNATGIDGTDPESMTAGELTCRRQIGPILEFLREVAPGFERCYLIAASASLGVRETRHFRGMKTITERDIADARVFEDWVVARAHFNFDVHNITGSGLDVSGAQRGFTQQKGYTIPYGCLVPERIDGLLFAGRNISGTHLAHSNYRVMPICANIGQAAGVAAAICAARNIEPRTLDPATVQAVLRASGIDPGNGTMPR
jgi:hypothetical protein